MNPPHRSRSRIHAFRYAFSGLWFVLRTQRNTWIHAIATAIVIALGIWLKIALIEWAVLILAICFVWLAEIINTALEAVTDLASPEIHPLARVGKDIGAGAVLLASIVAVIVGLIIFIPPLKLQLSGN
jgi:diacylglycerol kinase